jgi:hypothetical protein
MCFLDTLCRFTNSYVECNTKNMQCLHEDTTVCSSIDEDTFARQYIRFVPTNDVNFVVGLKLLSDSLKRGIGHK